MICEAFQELNEKAIGSEKDSKIAAKSTETLQQANCFAAVLPKKLCRIGKLWQVTCECSSMFEPQCAMFLLKHSFIGSTTSSTGLDGNPEADELPSCRVKGYKKGLGRHATGHLVSQISHHCGRCCDYLLRLFLRRVMSSPFSWTDLAILICAFV